MLVSGLLQGQEDDFKPSFSIGITASGDYSYRWLTNDSELKAVSDFRNNDEIGIIGFHAGLRLKYQVKENSAVVIGLVFGNSGFRNNWIEDFITPSPDPNFPYRIRFTYRQSHLKIPIEYVHYFRTGSGVLYIGAGLSGDFLINGTRLSESDYGNQTIENREVYKEGLYPFSLGFKISAGMAFPIFKSKSLELGPTFRSHLSPSSEGRLKDRLWSVGCQATLWI